MSNPASNYVFTKAVPMVPDFVISTFGALKWVGDHYEFVGDPHESAKAFARYLLNEINDQVTFSVAQRDKLTAEVEALREMFLRAIISPDEDARRVGYKYLLRRHPYGNAEVEAVKKGEPVAGLLKRLCEEDERKPYPRGGYQRKPSDRAVKKPPSEP